MDRIEKVKNYLIISGYSEDRIKKLTSNPKCCNAIYNQIVAYEKVVAEKSIQSYERLNVGRKK